MSAAANKPGAVHYALIVFVMIAVMLGITTYMFHRDASDRFVELAKVKAENQNLSKLQRTLDNRDEMINAKTQEIARLRAEVNMMKDELAQKEESRDKE